MSANLISSSSEDNLYELSSYKSFREFFTALFHPGPITTLLLISSITLCGTFCDMQWWPPDESISGLLFLFIFLTLSGQTLFHFIISILVGPGYVPKNWKPENETDCANVQYCKICSAYKAPRAHHCRKCNRCVLKMDHHCPWINDCVGHKNHAHFVSFLTFAVLGCSQAVIIIMCSLYHALNRRYYLIHNMKEAPIVYVGTFYGFLLCLFILGCAFGVALGVSALLYYQIKIIVRNCTSIEEWIEEKAHYRRKLSPQLEPYKNPYDFGTVNNWHLVINLRCKPHGDGIIWPVIEGANQYSMTTEQVEQKKDKEERIKEMKVIKNYSGTWCPFLYGFSTCIRQPCSLESRVPLKLGQTVLVSRWKKHWLYGEVKSSATEDIKGWFPRSSVIYLKNCQRCNKTVSNTQHDHQKQEHEEISTHNYLKDKDT